jgi:two-component system, cell cycle sensor histidine kinase and response regulator CckA
MTIAGVERKAERKRAHNQAERTRRMEGVEEIVEGVIHDFNNILFIISTYAGIVAEALTPDSVALRTGARSSWEDTRENVETIRLATSRGADLTRQLLNLTTGESSALGSVDVNLLMRGIGRLLRRSIGANVHLVTAVSPGTWPIRVDPGDFERIFLNLAANARYAMPEGGVLTISVQNVEATNAVDDTVQFCVSDTGTGMTPDTVRRAFETHFTTKPANEGSGLGLASVQRIVFNAGGTVAIASELGQGTTLTLALPVGRIPPLFKSPLPKRKRRST